MLRSGRTVEPEHLDEVTVFFSDIVGYTELSAKLPPGKVMQMLNRLYSEFDALAKRHSIFKVETIGDVSLGISARFHTMHLAYTASGPCSG